MLRPLIAKLGAAYHWQPSEIKGLAFYEALAYVDEAFALGLLEKKG